VLEELSWENVQEVVDSLPPAKHYCTDQSAIYPDVLWPEGSSHVVSKSKEQTHTVESLNANLRHYLKRLCRKTRAFSKCIQALRRAVRLFVWFYNRRQRIVLARDLSKHQRCSLSLYA
jgi:IS1 family transposase